MTDVEEDGNGDAANVAIDEGMAVDELMHTDDEVSDGAFA